MNFPVFIWYAVSTTFTPGPNNLMIMSTAGKYGFKRAMRYCMGVCIGFFLLLLVAAAFSMVLYSAMPNIAAYMKILGAIYILWLAYVILRDKPHVEKEGGARNRLRPDSVFTGIILQFINPKGIIYAIVSMSTFVLPHYQAAWIICLFAAGLVVITFVSLIFWALCGAAFEKLFSRNKKLLNILLAVLLVYCAVALFL